MRMKAAMNAHVDQECHVMFQESASEVQKRLQHMVRGVEETMSNRVDEVFLAMRRDYRSVLGGGEDAQRQVLPKVQRLMRKEVISIIEGVESIFQKVMDGGQTGYDEEGEDESRKMENAGDEETHSMNGDEKPEIDGASGLESKSDRQDVSHDVGSKNESGKGVDTENESSKEDHQDSDSDSAQHSSSSESAVVHSDSDD